MSLTASMWTGVSGLLGHGEKMNVVGNNLANVSTVGFKAQRMDFEDFMYATTHSAAGPAQIGRGVQIGTVMGDFSQGSFETTNSAIDLAISGAGFFKVQRKGTEEAFYTRAGNFQFDTEGYLVDPHGYAVQGWKIDNSAGPTRSAGGAGVSVDKSSGIKGTGVPTDVRLDTWTVPPKATTKVSVITNLSADGADNSKNAGNPFASLIQSWDGTQPPPNDNPAISESSYSYSTSIKVYDKSGVAHTLTVYYDKVDSNSYEGSEGETMWEYLVTMDPAQDKRQVWDSDAGGLVDINTTKAGGLLMSGTMTFSDGGDLLNQTAYTLFGGLEYVKDAAGNPDPDTDPNYTWADPGNHDKGVVPNTAPGTGLNDWADITKNMYPAAVSNSGYPMMVANFTGSVSANTAGSPEGDDHLIEFNLGLKVSDFSNPWSVPNDTTLWSATQTSTYGGTLTENKLYTKDGNHGPKVVENKVTGVAYNKDCSEEYIAAMRADRAAGVTTNYENWRDKWTDPVTGTYATEAEALEATWPYVTDGPDYTDGYDPDDPAVMRKLLDKTPNSAAIGWMTGTPVREAYPTTMLGTNYATSNGTGQNGYTFGNLTGYDVDADGVLYGIYSNGVTLGLYQLTLYDFTCQQGLRREGGNLYSQTMESGEAFFGAPQTNGMGKINSHSLEQSNVDMAREFVQMITTQRGFQANSKVVTTTDTMLETVVTMKR